MDKATFDALCALKYHATTSQLSEAVLTIQSALNAPAPTMSVSTTATEEGIWQKRDVMGEVTYSFASVCAKQMDDAIRARLLELGWLPPEEAQKLRDLRWQQGERGEE